MLMYFIFNKYDASTKTSIRKLYNVKTELTQINNQYGNYFEKCYHLASGIMIGYSLNQSTVGILTTLLTQIDSYIIALQHSNGDKTMNTIECTISTLYYI